MEHPLLNLPRYSRTEVEVSGHEAGLPGLRGVQASYGEEGKKESLQVAENSNPSGWRGGVMGVRVGLVPQATLGQSRIILMEKNILGVAQRNT